MKAIAYYHGPQRIKELAMAFAKGCAKHNVRCTLASVRALGSPQPADVVWMYGMGEGKAVFEAYAGRALRLVGDVGYWREQLRCPVKAQRYVRVSADAQQPDKHLRRRPHDPSRFLSFGLKYEPVQTRGDYVLVCGVGPKQSAMNGLQYGEWEQWAIDKLRQHTKRPILVREKPKNPPIPNAERCHIPALADAIRGAWAVVCLTGNIGADAILHGVPVIADAGPGRVYYPDATLESVDTIQPMSDDARLSALADISQWNWTPDEIARGKLWASLNAEGMV